MPLDPQAQEILDQLDELGLPPNHTISPEEARTNLLSKPRPKGPEVGQVEGRIIANGDFQVPTLRRDAARSRSLTGSTVADGSQGISRPPMKLPAI